MGRSADSSGRRAAGEGKVPRIGPLFHSLKPQTDPDPARTEKVVAALKALEPREGRRSPISPLLTSGARERLRGRSRHGPGRPAIAPSSSRNRTSSARKIERHKGEVSRILHYRLVTDKADRGLLIHLTADGTITDYDIVED